MSKIEELLQQVASDLNLDNKKAKATVTQTGDNVVNIRIEVLEDKSAEIERESFEKFVKQLPDDLFIEAIECLGQDEVNRINKCLSSDDIEAVRSGVLKFKSTLKKVTLNRIKELSDLLPSC